jgi:hypothetical protein
VLIRPKRQTLIDYFHQVFAQIRMIRIAKLFKNANIKNTISSRRCPEPRQCSFHATKKLKHKPKAPKQTDQVIHFPQTRPFPLHLPPFFTPRPPQKMVFKVSIAVRDYAIQGDESMMIRFGGSNFTNKVNEFIN